MTLWLAGLAAYSIQLAALVGAAAAVMALARVDSPRVTLRFWQALFVVCVLLPAAQVLLDAGAVRSAPAGIALPNAASSPPLAAWVSSVPADSPVATYVFAALAIGMAVRLGWLALGLRALRAIRAASEPACELSALSSQLQNELGARADIRFSSAVGSPATIGARRPIVLLPYQVRDLAPGVQRAVLCHELLHVRHGDWATALLEEIWCACLWFHPAARALASRLALSREMLIDRATIVHTRDRQVYAAALLQFSDSSPRLAGATGLIGRRHLEQRIARIAQETSMPTSTLALRTTIAAAAVFVTALAATASFPIGAVLHAQAGKVYDSEKDQGVSAPRIVKEVKPTYTAAAMQARIEGSVWMRAIVQADGTVGDVSVVKSLDKEHGLDQQAVDATRQWTFEPGRRDGKPVAVHVTIEMTFTLKK